MSEYVKIAQRVLRALAGYRGAIDGQVGPQSLAAAGRVHGVPTALSPERMVVAAAQAALEAQGFEPGPIDGLYGPQTDFAYRAWCGDALPDRSAESGFASQDEMHATFGPAGARACTAGLVRFPWPAVLAWDRSQAVHSFACHEKVAASAQRALDRVAAVYSPAEIRALGLDQYGGCFNLRRMRNGTALSTHAYGVAIDFDPMRNLLGWNRPEARLSAPDAAPFWEAFEAEGWTSLGRARNYDWMHVQAPGLA